MVSDDFRMSFSQKPSMMPSDVVPCSSRLRHKGSKARELANEKYTKIFLHLQVDIQIHVNSLCLKMTGTHMSALFFGVFRPAWFPYACLWGSDFYIILTPSCLHARKLTWNPSLEKAIYTKLMSS